MKHKFLLFLIVVVTSLFLFGCSETVNLKIVSPSANYRLTDQFVEGGVPVPVSVYYNGTEAQKIAIIKNVNTGESFGCTLLKGKENICGSTRVTKLGAQSIQVFVAKKNSEIVSETATFSWIPYQGLEKIAFDFSGNFGDKSMPLGMLYLAIATVLLVGSITGTIVLVTALNRGYTSRQGTSTKVTFIHKDGHKAIIDHKPGNHFGPGQFDNYRGSVEPAVFQGYIEAMFPKKEGKRIILAQPDRDLMLGQGDEVIDADEESPQKPYYGPYR